MSEDKRTFSYSNKEPPIKTRVGAGGMAPGILSLGTKRNGVMLLETFRGRVGRNVCLSFSSYRRPTIYLHLYTSFTSLYRSLIHIIISFLDSSHHPVLFETRNVSEIDRQGLAPSLEPN